MSSVFLLLLLLCTVLTLATSGSNSGFRVRLKLANANLSMAERLSRAANRRLAPLNGVTVPVLQDQGGYIAEFDIGQPPQRVQAIVDPMTDLVWTQSSTCRPNCFAQNLGFFNFSLSYTDYPVPCDHSMCAAGYETKPCMGSGDDNDEGTMKKRVLDI